MKPKTKDTAASVRGKAEWAKRERAKLAQARAEAARYIADALREMGHLEASAFCEQYAVITARGNGLS